MGNRKLWGRGDHDASVEHSQPSGGEPPVSVEEDLPEDTSSLKQRIDEYDSPGPGPGPSEVAKDDTPPDLDEVGAEVGTVLKAAHEAASRIRGQARDEAAKTREEAKAAAAAELEEAQRARHDAEAEAESIRADATAQAEQLRAEAEREAEQHSEEARLRLERADLEVEKRLREAERTARRRRNQLEAESRRYEDRLEKMLGVFRGMSAQLEDLLGRPAGAADDTPEETLEDALQPSSGSEHAA